MEEKRSYYAIIPANVRYDANLIPNAKLLYGEITALCNDKGYCWATNNYFSDLYGVSIRCIRQWISALEKRGYIMTETTITSDGSKRYITISKCVPSSIPPEENFLPPGRNLPPHPEEIFLPTRKKSSSIIIQTNTTVNKSVCQSSEKLRTDRRTDEIRESLKKQIEYDYFEDNFPEDLPGVDALVDCMSEMLISPTTKINGNMQPNTILKLYIDKVDSESVRGFLTHMRGKKMRDVKKISAYWQSAFINFIREEELVKLTI